MKKLVTTLCAAVFLAAFAAPGLAAPAPRPKVQIFNLLGSDIEGTLIQPNGTWIPGGPRVVLESLIEYREHFNAEMVKLSEEL